MKESAEWTLVAMRLKDMVRVHPAQVTGKCSRCGEVVGIYPSGQRVMKKWGSRVEVVCQVCIPPFEGDVDTILAPGAVWEPFESKKRE